MNELKKEIARIYKLADSGSIYADGKRAGMEELLHFMGEKYSIETDSSEEKSIKWEK